MKTQTPFQLIAAPFTPMQQGGAIDLNRVKPYYEFLRERGVDGAFVCGTTGEGALMTAEERKQVVAAWTARTWTQTPLYSASTLLLRVQQVDLQNPLSQYTDSQGQQSEIEAVPAIIATPELGRAAARLMAVVVFPTPPFWFTTARTTAPPAPEASGEECFT